MKDIILASGNAGKLQEIKALLGSYSINLQSQSKHAVPEAEETGLTFVENAILKARNACDHTGLPSIADDSGIEVDCLQGKPGIYSARYAGEHASNEDNIKKLLTAIAATETERASARFQCVIVFLRYAADPTPLICQGSWEGNILAKPQGDLGFGYDPIFYIEKYGCSAAELPLEVKNQISHRAIALQQLANNSDFKSKLAAH